MSDALAPTPPGFAAHVHRQTWTVAHPRRAVWAWLDDPATFIDGQLPPYRVEFVGADGEPAAFAPGVYTAHHGPGMLFAGTLGEITAPAPGQTAYRDLRYGYGSYAGSLRLARPTRLQFWVDADGPARTSVTVQLDADVARRLRPAWALAMRVFWSGFGRALSRQVALRRDGAPPSVWRRRPVAALAGAVALGAAAWAARR